jgi:hypothetical protein
MANGTAEVKFPNDMFSTGFTRKRQRVAEAPVVQSSELSRDQTENLLCYLGQFVTHPSKKINIAQTHYHYEVDIAGIEYPTDINEIVQGLQQRKLFVLETKINFNEQAPGRLTILLMTAKPAQDAYRVSQDYLPKYEAADYKLEKWMLPVSRTGFEEAKIDAENALRLQSLALYSTSYLGDETPKAISHRLTDAESGGDVSSKTNVFLLTIKGWTYCTGEQLAAFQHMFPFHVPKVTFDGKCVYVHVCECKSPMRVVWRKNPQQKE